jgi:hypothetical protein
MFLGLRGLRGLRGLKGLKSLKGLKGLKGLMGLKSLAGYGEKDFLHPNSDIQIYAFGSMRKAI